MSGTRRTPIDRQPRSRITPEALSWFCTARGIEAAGMHKKSKAQGGRREEYLHAVVELDWCLNIMPWSDGIFDVGAGMAIPCPDEHDTGNAIILRRQLEALA
jgi:hypothetical protein